jgi:two-component system alkaline phosphatase synthesis response regulator PhoP
MKERILVVEDEPTIATALRDDLELEGYAVEVVDDGTLALARILEEKFDLILLDLMLPGMDGLDVCRQARIKAVLRRSQNGPEPGKIYRFGDITVDIGRCEVLRRGERIDLTATEFKLLQVFLENRGRVLTIDDLLQKAWGSNAILTDRVVYTHVHHLRGKLEENPQKPRFLTGVRGIGYRFDG